MPPKEPGAIQTMFDRISGRYDLLNTILSVGGDAGWRRRAAQAARLGPGNRALDVACGSGKLTKRLLDQAPGGLVVGLDFSPGMLRVAGSSAPGPHYVRGDGLSLPFPDRAFDAATVAFGLRNFSRPERGLQEMRRVLIPGGRVVVLEFVRPSAGRLVGGLHRLYLSRVLPWVGSLISGDSAAYRYLSDSVAGYHTAEELAALGRAAGWRGVSVEILTWGAAALLTGFR